MLIVGFSGGVAQLGEHELCKLGVVGSIPIASTNFLFHPNLRAVFGALYESINSLPLLPRAIKTRLSRSGHSRSSSRILLVARDLHRISEARGGSHNDVKLFGARRKRGRKKGREIPEFKKAEGVWQS